MNESYFDIEQIEVDPVLVPNNAEQKSVVRKV